MYRRYAVKFNKKQLEFVNCVNMVERVKRSRALPKEGLSSMGVRRYVVTSAGSKERPYYTMKDCR